MEFRLRKFGVNANCQLQNGDTTIEIGLLNKAEATALLNNFKSAVADLECFLEVEVQKPTVVIHVEGDCLTGVTTSHEMTAILADYDVNDSESKTTPYDSEARIVNVSVDVCPEEIDYWVALVED